MFFQPTASPPLTVIVTTPGAFLDDQFSDRVSPSISPETTKVYLHNVENDKLDGTFVDVFRILQSKVRHFHSYDFFDDLSFTVGILIGKGARVLLAHPDVPNIRSIISDASLFQRAASLKCIDLNAIVRPDSPTMSSETGQR